MPFKDPVRKREYNKAYQKRYYAKQKNNAKAKAKARRHRIREWFDEYRRNLTCIDCGISGKECPWLIEFHHRDPDLKEEEIGFLVGAGYGIPRIMREMDKCDPICPNCHRRHHWEEKVARGQSIYAERANHPAKDSVSRRAQINRNKRKQAVRRARKSARQKSDDADSHKPKDS